MNLKLKHHLALAAEALDEVTAPQGNGEAQKVPENEVVFYAQIGNWLGLEQARSMEDHVQWEIKIQSSDEGAKRRVRVRKTTPLSKAADHGIEHGSPGFVMTAKTKLDTGNEVTGNTEENVDVNEGVFLLFQSFAENGMIKRRFNFLANSVTIRHDGQEIKLPETMVGFEVDLFPLKGGQSGFSPWVKIDVEVDAILNAIKDLELDHKKISFDIDPAKLPFKPVNIIQPGSPETDAAIQQLYDTVFLSTPKELETVSTILGKNEMPEMEPLDKKVEEPDAPEAPSLD